MLRFQGDGWGPRAGGSGRRGTLTSRRILNFAPCSRLTYFLKTMETYIRWSSEELGASTASTSYQPAHLGLSEPHCNDHPVLTLRQ